MNLVVLLVGARVWEGSALDAFARVTLALACLSIEMQAVTLLGVGSLRVLVAANAIVALAAFLFWRPARPAAAAVPVPRADLPWTAVLAMASLGLVLAIARPLTGADPYHLDRVAQILRLGTLEYDVAADLKANVLASLYELVLADLGAVPGIGNALVRLHGLVSFAYFTLGVAAVRTWMPRGRRWCWSAPFAVPVVFHQLALVKNDLFSATPALVALCWMTARAPAAEAAEIGWMAALVGLAVAIKWVSFPLAGLMIAVSLWRRPRAVVALGAVTIGGAAGALAGGLPFTLAQTARWYGHALQPLAALGNRTTGAADAAVSVGRFLISLVDFGAVTRRVWPARGGWGATFGAPLLWAVVAAAVDWRRAPVLRRAISLAAIYGVAFAAVYPDADIAHRLVLAPGLLLVSAAASESDGESPRAIRLRRVLIAALAVSAIQIARSFYLYVVAGG